MKETQEERVTLVERRDDKAMDTERNGLGAESIAVVTMDVGDIRCLWNDSVGVNDDRHTLDLRGGANLWRWSTEMKKPPTLDDILSILYQPEEILFGHC